MSRGRILVIRGGAIGDFILTLPVLAALRKHFPQTHLEVLGYPHIASLAHLAGYAHAVRSIEARALATFFARRGKLDAAMGEYFGGFNLIISYLYDPDAIFQENVGRCSKAQFIVAPHRPDHAGRGHATEVLLEPLQRLAIFDADPVPRIELQAAVDRRLIAVHPGSGSESKNWPEERWSDLLRLMCEQTDWRVLIVGGEAEQSRLQRLASLVPVERLSVAVNQPLTELAGRLARARGFVGHDSGITHLAAAVGVSGVAIWGESDERVWRPRSDAFHVLRAGPGLANLRAAEVFAALERILGGIGGRITE